MDREKVMSWLEGLAEPDWRECYSDSEVHETARQALDFIDELLKEQDELGTELTNAVELIRKKNERIEKLLKEQEAVKPILIREGRNKNYNDYVCPRCDNNVVYEQNYCSDCGVRFLWEGR